MEMNSEQVLGAFHPCMTVFYNMYFLYNHRQSNLQDTCNLVCETIAAGILPESLFNAQDELNKSLYTSILRTYCRPKIHTFIATNECSQAKSTADIYINMQHEPAFFAETKYDGERMQIHISSDRISIFSKSGRNSTVDREQSLDIIKTCIGRPNDLMKSLNVIRDSYYSNVDECIVEGELLVFNATANNGKGGIERFGGISDFRTIFGKGQ